MGAAEACNSVCIHVVAEKIRDIEEAKNVLVVLSESCANQTRISSGTVTPDTNRENGEENHEHEHDMSSPLTVTSCALSAPWFDGNLSEIPNEAFLDSGADKSSHHSKYWEDSRTHAMRRLNFSCPTYDNSVRDDASYVLNLGGEISDEEYLFEIVYGFILEVIVSEQQIDELLLDSPRTPKPASGLSWIAETCPGAPIKSTRKCRNNIDNQVCRKLGF